MRFTRLVDNVPTRGILDELDAAPYLWNVNDNRLVDVGPHRETQDIWVRYRDQSEIVGPHSLREPHLSVWYPAWHMIPSLRPVVFALSAFVGSVHMGGILLTRIPPHKTVFPHDDRGTWHSEYHNAKVWIPLRANEDCLNICEDETVVMPPGTAWTFDNLTTHSVENRGETDRIALICCFRSE